MKIRSLTAPQELKQVEALQASVWGCSNLEIVPVHQLVASVMTGGIVLGAWREDRLVGFCYAFPGGGPEGLYLYSHAAAVLPDHQGTGIGSRLKQAQRDWARGRGYAEIRWTFDPHQPGNAHFNLRRLSARAIAFLENHYGPLDDQLNRNRRSDRLLVSWPVDQPPPAPRGEAETISLPSTPDTLRLAFQRAFAGGRTAVDFQPEGDGGRYILL